MIRKTTKNYQRSKSSNRDSLTGAQNSAGTAFKSTAMPSKKHFVELSQTLMGKYMEKLAYKRSLIHVQKQLTASEKILSKIVHRPVIDKFSEVVSYSVARPSGILGGGLVSLVGSSFLLYTAKHYGFEYNFTAFFVLYVLGFCTGLVGELGFKVITRKH